MFDNPHFRLWLQQRITQAVRYADQCPNERILENSNRDLCEHIVAKFALQVPELQPEEKYMDHEPVVLDQVGLEKRQFVFVIPYVGDMVLFDYQPSTFDFNPPLASVTQGEIRLFYEVLGENQADQVRNSLAGDLEKINLYLGRVKKDVDQFYEALRLQVKERIAVKKLQLLKTSEIIEELRIPIKRRRDLPEPYEIAITPKKKRKPLKLTHRGAQQFVVSQSDYEDIFHVTFSMSLLMERSPRTFAKLSENEIRDHFLMLLNAYYEGQAVGETFNCMGKTDILIRKQNENAFIAECKIWDGREKFNKTINQLLSYVTWRDTKTAILSFFKGKEFTNTLKTINNTITNRSCFVKPHTLDDAELANSETVQSYILHHPDDSAKNLFLTVLSFPIRTSNE